MTTRVSLPSINEMFPEHMMKEWYAPSSPSSPSSSTPPSLSPVAKPRRLTHIALPALAPPPPQQQPAVRSPTLVREESFEYPSQRDGEEKKHSCPHCHKRFNRPSSLSIHVNTHTGAKPFQCPHPGCKRRFNVNSNMRRHWRNHASPRRPTSPPPPPTPSSPSSSPYSPSPSSVMYAPYTPSSKHASKSPAEGETPPLSFSPSASSYSSLASEAERSPSPEPEWSPRQQHREGEAWAPRPLRDHREQEGRLQERPQRGEDGLWRLAALASAATGEAYGRGKGWR